MLCVSIAERTFSSVGQSLKSCMQEADMAEIRLDSLAGSFSEKACRELLSLSPIPLIFTCRKGDEGGQFAGTEEERIKRLAAAVDAGAPYVDVELRTEAGLRNGLVDHAHGNGCMVIMSWHNFSETPELEELERVLSDQVASGADIAKIVTMGRESGDIPRLFSLYYMAYRLDIPLVSFCMGETGKISRVASLAMGAFFTFASVDDGTETAPGQIPLHQFRKIMDICSQGTTSTTLPGT